jgi:hypothetical protein
MNPKKQGAPFSSFQIFYADCLALGIWELEFPFS